MVAAPPPRAPSFEGERQDLTALRDQFAGQALGAILLAAGAQAVLKQETFLLEPICKDAYDFAEGMLAERKRRFG